ncbi:MAG: MBL fold metallo-hydrolase [Gammaproteobacteria bacterium]
MIRLSFHGAAKQMTGSCYLLECDQGRILVDCGMFQGHREIEEENQASFGFEPANIDYLLLTHAHLDHCGRIPLLVKRGFRGEIIATAPTRELARLVLVDAAELQEEEHRRRTEHARRRNAAIPEPLYTIEDAFHAQDYFGRGAHYDQDLELKPGLRARFINAGHILGSASIIVTMENAGKPVSVLFSGDLGSPGRPIINDATLPPHVDFVLIETTYGDRAHRPRPDSVKELYEAINVTLGRNGNVIIPTFALERTQEILYYLREGLENGQLPRYMNVFLDSPMAISATDIFRRYPDCYDSEMRKRIASGDPFAFPGLHFLHDISESMALNRVESGAVILAGSGMCTGGRIRHHLKHNLWREKCGVVFVGYAAQGTLARQIIDGAKEVRVFREPLQVRAEIWTINGFSAHADQPELLAWLKHTGKPRTVYLVHGELEHGMQTMRDKLAAADIHWHIPGMHETVKLG